MTAEEANKELVHLITACLYGPKNPIARGNDFITDSYNRFNHDPVPLEIVPMRDRIKPFADKINANMAIKKADIGFVSDLVSKFEAKEKELPAKMDRWEAMTRLAFPGDTDVLRLLYFIDRKKLAVGTETERMVGYKAWLLLIKSKSPEISLVLDEATQWVSDLGELSGKKGGDKDTVTDDRTGITDLMTGAYQATLQNIGDLLILYPDKIEKILGYFDAKKLVPNESNPGRLFKNDYLVKEPTNVMVNLPEVKYELENWIVFDNKTDRDFKAFRSVNSEIHSPDYAINIPAHTKVKIKVRDLGPDTALYFMIEFSGLPVTGYLKITVRKTK